MSYMFLYVYSLCFYHYRIRWLATCIDEYKTLLKDNTVDEKYLMVTFDNIMEFAEEHNNKNSTYHKLMDCRKREKYKRFKFIMKMKTDRPATTDMFLPWKSLPPIAKIMVAPIEDRFAYGVIKTKYLMNQLTLYETMKKSLSNSDANIVLIPQMSMKDYCKLVSGSIKL